MQRKEDYKESLQFLEDKKILVIDSSKSFSRMIQSCLIEMGIRSRSITLVSSYQNAQELISELKPEIIISDYNVNEKSGLEFAVMQKKYLEKENDRVFILATSNSSESAIVDALEEEVDGCLLKPFSPNDFQKTFKAITASKESPSQYKKVLETAKALRLQHEFEQAEELVKMAMKLKPESAMPFACLGDIQRAKQNYDEALSVYSKGLDLNPKHYRCLKGKFEVLELLGEKEQAYDTIKFFIQSLPLGSEVLERAFCLVLETKNFQDMELYYEIYRQKENRSMSLVKTVCSSLYKSGKVCAKEGQWPLAEKMFSWCIISSGRNLKFIEKVIKFCIDKDKKEAAEKFFKLYPADQVGTDHHSELDFYIAKSILSPEEIVEKGRQLLAKGTKKIFLYKEIIQQLLNINLAMAAENMTYEAIQRFPDKRDELEAIATGAKI